MSSRRELANAIRALAMDAVQQANSGHPGMPMGMADIAEVLWNDFLRHNPGNPDWPNRDRFLNSNGHGSMLLYALLHLAGYDMPIEELKRFRQLHSKTPGHPEYSEHPAIETTTGPLGQGLATAVGMAMAARRTRALFDPEAEPGQSIFDHSIYVFASDGDFEEGVSGEASSLAGHQRLGELVVLYDDNHISIEGDTAVAFSEDVLARYAAYGWHTLQVDDANDVPALFAALAEARDVRDRPSIIGLRSIIA
ncbi:MAG TPA: transketolase, partial [Candidatus Saccharimonadia bacterium]|nr:transketolase [Candidatus Saccharimonadia bacterium]